MVSNVTDSMILWGLFANCVCKYKISYCRASMHASKSTACTDLSHAFPWEGPEGEEHVLWLTEAHLAPLPSSAPAQVLEQRGFGQYVFLLALSEQLVPDLEALQQLVLTMLNKVSGSQIPAGPLGNALLTHLGDRAPLLLLPAKHLGARYKQQRAAASSHDALHSHETNAELDPAHAEHLKARKGFLLDLLVSLRFFPELLPLVLGAHEPYKTVFARRLRACLHLPSDPPSADTSDVSETSGMWDTSDTCDHLSMSGDLVRLLVSVMRHGSNCQTFASLSRQTPHPTSRTPHPKKPTRQPQKLKPPNPKPNPNHLPPNPNPKNPNPKSRTSDRSSLSPNRAKSYTRLPHALNPCP